MVVLPIVKRIYTIWYDEETCNKFWQFTNQDNSGFVYIALCYLCHAITRKTLIKNVYTIIF